MRTKIRLTLWLGLVTLLVLVLAGIALATIWNLRSEGRDVLKANYNSIAYAQRMLEAVDLDGDTSTAFRALRQELLNQQKNVTEQGEQVLTDSLTAHIHAFTATPADHKLARTVRMDLDALIGTNRQAIVRKTERTEARAEEAVAWITVAGTICFLVVFTLFLSLPERIAEPIRKLTEGIDRITKGNYRDRVELQRNDEFGHMADRFNAMAGELERWENSNVARVMEEKARAEAVINSLRDASIGVDEQGRILFVNREALELLGLEEAEVTGRSGEEVARRNDLLQHILSDRSSTPFNAVVDGKENFFVCVSAPIDGAEGRLGTVYTVRNITPHKELDAAKTNFIATVSHELKTPIASILMSVELVRDPRVGPVNEEQRQLLHTIQEDSQRLLRITSELLKLTQVEIGKTQVELKPADPRAIVDYALAATRTAAEQRHISVLRELPDDLPNVTADEEKAAWTLTNLISNAIRYSPEGSSVTVSVTASHEGVEFTVADQGQGIEPRYVERVFDRYFRVPGATQEGSGLGLAISKEFIEAMGGRIGVTSSPGNGSRFWFALPTVRRDEDAAGS